MIAPRPLHRLALALLALLTLLGDGALHEGHHGLGGGGGEGATQLHDGSCGHLPAMHAEGPHDCLLCQSGSSWTLAEAPQRVVRVGSSVGLLPSRPAAAPVRRQPGPSLGPRGPPSIG